MAGTIQIHDTVVLKREAENLYPKSILSLKPQNNQTQYGSVVGIDNEWAEVESGEKRMWYKLNHLRKYEPSGGTRKTRTRKTRGRHRRYSRRR